MELVSHPAETAPSHVVTGGGTGMTAAVRTDIQVATTATPPNIAVPVQASGAAPELKKTGRPVHPLWAHFHRGEKRNRYHYHAFCIYCVARYGMPQVAPTRGVSTDMLRHLEKCTNCPRKIVESLKDICGRREAVRFDRYLKKKGESSAEEHAQQSQQQAQEHSAVLMEAAVAGNAHDAIQSALDGDDDEDVEQHDQQVAASDASPGINGGTGVTPGALALESSRSAPTGAHQALRRGVKHYAQGTPHSGSSPFKRLRGSENPSTELEALVWKTQVLRMAVVSGMPLEIVRNREFMDLMQSLSAPSPSSTLDTITDPSFLADSAERMAWTQLERVKEGMLNSTIKGGLTLSINCWATLDLQHLVAFTLLNSNGDASCVSVQEVGTGGFTVARLTSRIEDVLSQLDLQNICVMGVVADSIVALQAARRVCHEKHRSLLVVPCISRLLSVLAGRILTSDAFCEPIGELIELASYFVQGPLASALQRICEDQDAYICLPNREQWFSFVDCISSLLRHWDAIVSICRNDFPELDVPDQLHDMVLSSGDDGQGLKESLEELMTLLAPLRESYAVLVGQRTKLAASTKNTNSSSKTAETPSYGLTLAHVMYQFARMAQSYAALLGTKHGAFAQMMQKHLDTLWQRYDLPVMVLAFVFNFHFDTSLLNMAAHSFSWDAIAEYFQAYLHRWFEPTAPMQNNGAPATERTQTATANGGLVPISSDRINEIIGVYKMNQFPFDADTTSDYTDVSSFYSFVSDSHPEICALCCRMYAIALISANVHCTIRGIGFLPTVAQTTRSPVVVELLLHVGFASNLKPSAHDLTATTTAGVAASLGGHDVSPHDTFWTQDAWLDFASSWKPFLDRELHIDDEATWTQMYEARGDHARVCSNSDTAVAAFASLKVPLDQVFTSPLPPIPAAAVGGELPTDSVSDNSSNTSLCV